MRKLTTKEFIKRSREVHSDRYDYSKVEYVNNKTEVVIICPTHGGFSQIPMSHLSGIGCPHCANESKKLTQESFIQKANEVHDNKYDYSKVEYTHSATKVEIICPIHGAFEQVAGTHLRGSGCPHCGYENTGWTKAKFIDICESKNSHGTLYVLECYNENETFIKFGITSRTIERRYSDKIKMPYSYRILAECTGTPEMIYNLEVGLKNEMKLQHYTPQIEFNGYATECFVRTEEE